MYPSQSRHSQSCMMSSYSVDGQMHLHSPDDIEVAWEKYQPPHSHQHAQPNTELETMGRSTFHFEHNATYPQYNISPTSASFSSPFYSFGSSSAPSSVSPVSPSSSATFGNAQGMMVNTEFIIRPDPTVIAVAPAEVPVCLPTHRFFDSDFATTYDADLFVPSSPASSADPPASPATPLEESCPPSSTSPADSILNSSTSVHIASPPAKYPSSIDPSSMVPNAAKRLRTYNSSKDFVPPDVTGLNKREARLVKNRAAAYLSRMRKREEFGLMENRVAELEQDNARLKAIIEGHIPSPASSASASASMPSDEIENLRTQLTAARQREKILVERLECVKFGAQQAEKQAKRETSEPTFNQEANSKASTPFVVPESSVPASIKDILSNPKSSASIGLMVLLCALPSLLAIPSTAAPALPVSSSLFDEIDALASWDTSVPFTSMSTDASSTSLPDWEFDGAGHPRSAGELTEDSEREKGMGIGGNIKDEYLDCEKRNWRKLVFEGDGGSLGLGGLDITFDTNHSTDGLIRVRLHLSGESDTTSSTPPEGESAPPSSAPPLYPLSHEEPSFRPLSFSLPSNSYTSSLSLDPDPWAPFLGMGVLSSYTPGIGMPGFSCAADSSFINHRVFSSRENEPARRRVRITLKSMPQLGGEGGEWEVEFC